MFSMQPPPSSPLLLLLLLFFSSSSSAGSGHMHPGRREAGRGLGHLFIQVLGRNISFHLHVEISFGVFPQNIYIFCRLSVHRLPWPSCPGSCPLLAQATPRADAVPLCACGSPNPRVWCRHCMACHGFFGSLPRISPISLLPVLVPLELAPNENRVTCGDLRVRPNQRVLPEASQIQVIFFSFGS